MRLTTAIFLGLLTFGIAQPEANSGDEAGVMSTVNAQHGPIAVLTEREPRFRIPVGIDIRKLDPKRVEVVVSRISNPAATQFSICASLEWSGTQAHNGLSGSVEIGCFGVFPADRTGVYVLGAERAMHDFRKETGSAGDVDVRLLLEIRPYRKIPEGQAVEVEVSEVRWMYE